MTAPARRSGVLAEDVPESGECVLLDPESGRILALNAAGAALWELLDGQRDVPELAGILADAAQIPPEQAEADVRTLLEQLRADAFLAPDQSS